LHLVPILEVAKYVSFRFMCIHSDFTFKYTFSYSTLGGFMCTHSDFICYSLDQHSEPETQILGKHMHISSIHKNLRIYLPTSVWLWSSSGGGKVKSWFCINDLMTHPSVVPSVEPIELCWTDISTIMQRAEKILINMVYEVACQGIWQEFSDAE